MVCSSDDKRASRRWSACGGSSRIWHQSLIGACAVVVLVAIIAHADDRRDFPKHINNTRPTTLAPKTITATTATTVVTSTIPIEEKPCPGVALCLTTPLCRICLEAINASARSLRTQDEWWTLSMQELKSGQSAVNRALLSNPSCVRILIDSELGFDAWGLELALGELSWGFNANRGAEPLAACSSYYNINTINDCASSTMTAFTICTGLNYLAPIDCLECLQNLFGLNENVTTVSDAMHSQACTGPVMSEWVHDNNVENAFGLCVSFPMCSNYKRECIETIPGCTSCLALLQSGDGAGAARNCTTSIDDVVSWCSADTSVSCSYWLQRCADTPHCSSCLKEMGNGDSVEAILTDYFSDGCSTATGGLPSETVLLLLDSIAHSCPQIGACRKTVSLCILQGVAWKAPTDFSCATCLRVVANKSVPHPDDWDSCQQELAKYHFDVVCQPCPESVYRINTVVLVTQVVGGASATLCLAVVVTILAHGRDRVSMRDRIVIGLIMANTMYSIANSVPLNAMHVGVDTCGQLVMSFPEIRFWRGLWFCGKYGLVSFELLIVGASIRALLRGHSAVPLAFEAIMHGACVAVAVSAFAAFSVLCEVINTAGYNSKTETTSATNPYHYFGDSDDENDLAPDIEASHIFQSERAAYDDLVRDMLVVWDVLVGVVIVLWLLLRLMYHHALKELQLNELAVERAETEDVWADTRRSAWEARRRLLRARRDAFVEIATPMEPYIVLFTLFAVPALVMSTTFCQDRSGASTTVGGAVVIGENIAVGSSTLAYGSCDVWCEFALAFRSIGTVLVYLFSKERCVELVSVQSTCQKLWARIVAGSLCCTVMAPYAPLENDLGDEIEMNHLTQLSSCPPSAWLPNVGTPQTDAHVPERWQIDERDVDKVRQLGQGSFGTVWEATLRSRGMQVAVKILNSGAVDQDGDLVDPQANEDFLKECAALQNIDSPHLIKFFGFGSTQSGNGFIVTELVRGGSLEDVLHDVNRDLPWQTRVAIGLQVALGMEHLHERQMLHRDLKSANILVDEQLRAKVCDFGLARMFRPARQHIVYSPFTGVTRLMTNEDDIDILIGIHPALATADITVSIQDVSGKMTKATGTMRWMAPEVFRGDQYYGRAVDVYSFGIVLWELAMRATPWREIEDRGGDIKLFDALNRALQMGRRPLLSVAVTTQHPVFVNVMQQCWEGDPARRPTFSKVVNALAAYRRHLSESDH